MRFFLLGAMPGLLALLLSVASSGCGETGVKSLRHGSAAQGSSATPASGRDAEASPSGTSPKTAAGLDVPDPKAIDCTLLPETECLAKKSAANSRAYRTVDCRQASPDACFLLVETVLGDASGAFEEVRVAGCEDPRACGSLASLSGGGKTVTAATGSAETVPMEARAPRTALLGSDVDCVVCHVNIKGHLGTLAPFGGLRANAQINVTGDWFAASTWKLRPDAEANMVPKPVLNFKDGGQVRSPYAGPLLPRDAAGKPALPRWEEATFARSPARGSLSGPDASGTMVSVDKTRDGTLVLVGTEANPIRIRGEVLVRGDLVIKGRYAGMGTIYATGNIYVPANLQAMKSAYPFPDAPDDVAAAARKAVKEGTDALALAAKKSIFLGDLEVSDPSQIGKIAANTIVRNMESVYTIAPPIGSPRFAAATLGVHGIYEAIGGKDKFAALYEKAHACEALSSIGVENPRPVATGLGAFDVIEAFLYAENAVSGVSRRTSYAVKGGIMADAVSIIGGSMGCASVNERNPISMLPQSVSHIIYDQRLAVGLPLLQRLRPFFAP